MATEYLNLDELRSVEDLENYRSSLTADVQKWEDEFKGLPFPEEVRPDYKRHNDEIDAIDGRVSELKARNSRLARIAQRAENTEAGDSGPTVIVPKQPRDIYEVNRSLEPDEWNERAKYVIDEFRGPSHVDRAQAQEDLSEKITANGIVGQHIVLHSSPVYRSAWMKWMIAGLNNGPLNLNSVESRSLEMSQRAMSLTSANGGYAVPVDLDPTLINTSNGVVNPIRSVAQIRRTTRDTFNGVTTGAITAAYATEAAETTDNSPTLGPVVISTERAQAFVPMSLEIEMDWPSIRDELSALLADAKDTLEATKFLTGTGTNEPFGVITGATNTVNATTGQTFDLEDVYRLRQALPPRYRSRPVFMGNLAILDKIRQFETASGGTASGVVWQDSLQDDNPARLFGRPVFEASGMAATTATGDKFLLYGDFSRYIIVDRVGLSIDFIPHLFGSNQRPTGQRGLFAFWRNGAKVADANAFRLLIGIA